MVVPLAPSIRAGERGRGSVGSAVQNQIVLIAGASVKGEGILRLLFVLAYVELPPPRVLGVHVE